MIASPLYAYAICAAPPSVLPQGKQTHLVTITAAGLSVIAEPGLDVRLLAEAELIEAAINHDRVLCELLPQTALLPIRFGTHFDAETLVEQHLRDNGSAYEERLVQLRDRDEYCLKLTARAAELPEVSGTGRAYFAAKKMRVEQLSLWQAAQAEAKASWRERLQTSQATVHTDEAKELKAYLLLDGDGIAAWQTLQDPYWQVELIGPLPPYHFV